MMKDTILSKEDIVKTEVFSQGENGVHTYRIPAVAQAGDGTIMAFAEARRDNSGDPGSGHIDLVYKLSRDNGGSWSDMGFIEKSVEGGSISNPTVVVTRDSNRVLILYNRWKPGFGGSNSREGELDNQLFLRHSDDNGASWSEAVDITSQGRDVARWKKVVFGPGHGIETSKGRIVIPASAPYIIDGISKNASFALYSDDHGVTWRRGEQINASTNENQIVELEDGRLLIDARQGDNIPNRWIALSDDCGVTWSEPMPGQTVPGICTSVVKYRNDKLSGTAFFLWSGLNPEIPHDKWVYPADRRNLILRISADQCRSFPQELLVGSGPAGYSDLCVLKDGAVGIIWEGGEKDYFEKIFFTRVSVSR